jgi:hypothetical protein
MDDELKGILEQLSTALRDAIRGSERLQEILREIESRGITPSLTMGVVLGRPDSGERPEEIQQTLIGPAMTDRPVSIRRLSAFDRKFLRALRIQMPS